MNNRIVATAAIIAAACGISFGAKPATPPAAPTPANETARRSGPSISPGAGLS